MKRLKRYGWNLLIALDQLGNALLGGDPDETISSRACKLADRKPWARIFRRWLHGIDPGHCAKAIEPDEGKDPIF